MRLKRGEILSKNILIEIIDIYYLKRTRNYASKYIYQTNSFYLFIFVQEEEEKMK
jgi:hypothetical protein